MLTAVNVARSCRMVEPKERVIFVNASPPGHDKPAALKFIPAEHSRGEEQPEVSPRDAAVLCGEDFGKPELPRPWRESLFPNIVTLKNNYGCDSAPP